MKTLMIVAFLSAIATGAIAGPNAGYTKLAGYCTTTCSGGNGGFGQRTCTTYCH